MSRLRFVSYDEQPVWNFNAKPYTKTAPDRIEPQSAPRRPVRANKYPTNINHQDKTRERVEACISTICSRCIDITEGYLNWSMIGFSIRSEFGEDGRQYFHEVSQYHPGYDQDKTDRKYDEYKPSSPITIATFFQVCKEHGVSWKESVLGAGG